jgi:EAL domain-containing protein (putative c-di-GMP-specific phosphodiesterase class I)
MKKWYLVAYQPGNEDLISTHINQSVFQVGRQQGLALSLPSNNASRVHAEFHQQGDQLWLKDFGSTNGTFINHKRITSACEVEHGDIIHFADYEMRVMMKELPESNTEALQQTVFSSAVSLSQVLPAGIKELEELLACKAIETHFQPIVAADAQTIVAYEVLGRGDYHGLDSAPTKLFQIAESFNMAVQLSEGFRQCGLAAAEKVSSFRYFLNIHPQELNDELRFLNSMHQLRVEHAHLPLVLEIHEQAVTNLAQMKRIKTELHAMKIELAYDDFGAGQARLMELIEDPPEYLKFDMSLIQGIDKAPEAHVKMVSMFVDLARKMGVKTLAECVETSAEVAVCQQLGFDLFQGYYVSKPLVSPNFHQLQQAQSLNASP